MAALKPSPLDGLHPRGGGHTAQRGISESYWQHPSQVPLPPFSPEEEIILHSQEPLDRRFRFKMAEVAASFYFQHYNDQLCRPCAYQLVGKRFMEAYPTLMAEGANPWSSFVGAVSNKMRAKRFRKNAEAKERARYT